MVRIINITGLSSLFIVLAIMMTGTARAEGMVTFTSDYDVEETASRFESIAKAKGFTIFNRVRHSDAAKKVDVELAETQLFIFGNPAVGSKLMQCGQSVAIDLPQKVLIWRNDNVVSLAYNAPAYLAKRHELDGCKSVLDKVAAALAGLAKQATQLEEELEEETEDTLDR